MSTDRQPRRVPWGVIVGSLSLLMTVLMVASAWFVWDAVQGIRNPPVDQLPERADAVVVFAGEDGRFTLGRELVESGRAPVLVLNATELPETAEGWCEGFSGDVEVICLFPEEDSTRGEAVAFGKLAEDQGWTSLIGVTGDYHVQRAGLWLQRCFPGEVAMAQLDWGTPSLTLSTSELLGYGQSIAAKSGCE
jgi:uncharacterized SAM-binding protein YcdF (DUF218 family)